ncbi:MAG TPA: outer membrane beta-barrel protein [Pyrinomonadaceae bacterium]|nr:outer membrane beta-barrel protein [Pyrinomonadaceae bacterium]
MFTKSIRVFALVALVAFGLQQAQAQTDEKKFEVGAQGTLLRLPAITFSGTAGSATFSDDHNNNWGFGGRFGYNFSDNIGVEAEGNFFPQDRAEDGGQKFQGLFGAKVGQRFDKGGLFVKARPGFVRMSRGEYQLQGACVAIFPPPIACFQANATTNFAFDLGGVGEVYPTKNTIIRFDVGDTMIHFGAQRLVAARNPSTGELVVVPRAAETQHNLQASVGVGFRF